VLSLGVGCIPSCCVLTLHVYQVQNGLDRNFNEIVIVLYIDL
jgi:hypothetical protein